MRGADALIGWAGTAAALLYAGALARARVRSDLASSPYPSPREAEAEIDRLASSHPARARIEVYGRSREGRPLRALRIGAPGARARMLVSAQIHAAEYVGGVVARRVARELLERADRDAAAGALLADTEVVFATLLNPDGAERVWRRAGWSRLAGSRHTAAGVDPNRNFPFVPGGGARAWNSGRARPGSATYRGPHPLSEPECEALARLCARERFCAAVNFHSFGRVVYMPALVDAFAGEDDDPVARALEVFRGPFQSRQPLHAYRPVPERPAAIAGQLDAFLLGAFGTASVTVEVGRPGLAWLAPSRFANFFWLSNPPDPEPCVRNDVEATLHALCELRRATGGRAGAPRQPELARGLADAPAAERHPG